jgi:hypothetical protein
MRVHGDLRVRVRTGKPRAVGTDGAIAKRRALGGTRYDANVLRHIGILPDCQWPFRNVAQSRPPECLLTRLSSEPSSLRDTQLTACVAQPDGSQSAASVRCDQHPERVSGFSIDPNFDLFVVCSDQLGLGNQNGFPIDHFVYSRGQKYLSVIPNCRSNDNTNGVIARSDRPDAPGSTPFFAAKT